MSEYRVWRWSRDRKSTKIEGTWVLDNSIEPIKPSLTVFPPPTHYVIMRHSFSCFQLGFLFFEAEASSLTHSGVIGKSKLRPKEANNLPWIAELVNSREGSQAQVHPGSGLRLSVLQVPLLTTVLLRVCHSNSDSHCLAVSLG